MEPLVLLIERQADLRELNELILREAGYQVQTVSPNADPVAVAAGSHPKAIVLDIQVNHPLDWQILDQLNANSITETIPVVVISTSERAVTTAQATPVVGPAIVMPYDIDALQRAVATALKQPPPAAVLPPSPHPPPADLATVGRFLNAHSRALVLRAISCLQKIEPFHSHFPELSPGLVDNLPVMLGALTVALERGLTPEDAVAPPRIRAAIREHVELRLRQRFDPGAILREYQVLTDVILAYLQQQHTAVPQTADAAFAISRAVVDFTAAIERVELDDLIEAARRSVTAPPIT
jgi:CheY-like chemotaxis protein